MRRMNEDSETEEGEGVITLPAHDVLGVGAQDADRVRDDTGTSHCL